MAEAYINEYRQARLFAEDFLAANPKTHMVIVAHGGVRLTLDRSGVQRVDRACIDCTHDIPGNPEEPCYQAKEAA